MRYRVCYTLLQQLFKLSTEEILKILARRKTSNLGRHFWREKNKTFANNIEAVFF